VASTKLTTKQTGSKQLTPREIPTPRVRGRASTPPPERGLHSAPRRKQSAHVELATARDVRAALCHAIHMGIPPNRHLTIDLEAAGAADPISAIGKFLKLLSDAARRRGEKVSYVWVRETGDTVGDHVHILLHVPAIPNWFARRKARWLRLSGLTPIRGGSRTRVIKGCAQDELGNFKSPELYAANLNTLESYLMKHCSIEVEQGFGISSRGPSLVVGKRVSISQNLHRSARARCSSCARN